MKYNRLTGERRCSRSGSFDEDITALDVCFPTAWKKTHQKLSQVDLRYIEFIFRFILLHHAPYHRATHLRTHGKLRMRLLCMRNSSATEWTKKIESFRLPKFHNSPFIARHSPLHEDKSIFVGNKIYCSWHAEAKYEKYAVAVPVLGPGTTNLMAVIDVSAQKSNARKPIKSFRYYGVYWRRRHSRRTIMHTSLMKIALAGSCWPGLFIVSRSRLVDIPLSTINTFSTSISEDERMTKWNVFEGRERPCHVKPQKWFRLVKFKIEMSLHDARCAMNREPTLCLRHHFHSPSSNAFIIWNFDIESKSIPFEFYLCAVWGI